MKQKKVRTFPSWTGPWALLARIRSPALFSVCGRSRGCITADVEPMLQEWLNSVGCVVADDEFQMLLAKARGEFARVASSTDTDSAPHCPAGTLVACLYWDVQTLERGGTLQA